jgi:anti-anti-sigma factor
VSDLADVRLEDRSGQPVARITGEVDASNAGRLAERIYDGVSNEAYGLVIDLTEVTYIDSAGVRLLFDLAARLERRQLRLHLVSADGSHVTEVVELVALDEVAGIHRNLDDAIAALNAGAD